MDDAIECRLVGVAAGEDFDEFYRSCYHDVLRVVAGVTANRHVAAEVTQESFVAAYRRWSKISAYDRPDLWVRRVALNRALSWRKRIINEARAITRSSVQQTARHDDPSADGEVWAHVRKLPRRQAAMIALVYVDDMTVEQAAGVLQIAVPTAKTHLQRARRTLAERLDEEIPT